MSARPVDELLTELETVAARLRGGDAHFAVGRGVAGWEVSVFVDPVDHTEVQRRDAEGREYGLVRASSLDLYDALSVVLSACWGVDRDLGVAS